MFWLLFPALALAFSSAPKRSCTDDVGCVLVKDLACGEIQAVSLGQDEAWAAFQAKQQEARKDKKQECVMPERPDHRDYAAVCQSGECVAVKRTLGVGRVLDG